MAISLGGCATFAPPVPEGYKGPVAIMKDSVKPYSERKADFFYVAEIDGKRIENSRVRTLSANQGRGVHMTPSLIERDVPARNATFTLVGRTEYAAPILTLTNTVYQVKGAITRGQLLWRIKYSTLGGATVLTNVRITDTLGTGQVVIPGSVR